MSFVDGIRARPEVSLWNCASEERRCDRLIQGLVCVGLGNSLNGSNLSRLWRTMPNPSGKHLI